MVFAACMKFRSSIVSQMQLTDDKSIRQQPKVYSHLTDAINDTLCPKGKEKYHNKACLNRKCKECGVHKLQTLAEEEDQGPNTPH